MSSSWQTSQSPQEARQLPSVNASPRINCRFFSHSPAGVPVEGGQGDSEVIKQVATVKD